MQLLPVFSRFDALHHDVFRRHEGKFLRDVLGDDLLVDDEIFRDIHVDGEDGVRREECLRVDDAAVGRVVEGALEPLCGSRDRRVHGKGHQIAGERAHAFAAHRVALVRHRRGADLRLFEGLLHLLHVLEKADVVGEFVGALRDLGEHAEDVVVELAGVRLPRDAVHLVIAHLFNDAPFKFLDLLFVAVEKFQKACLGARRALDAAELEVLFEILQALVVEHKILQPQRRALAHRRELGGL